MVRINNLLSLKISVNRMVAKKINTANNFIFEGKSVLPEPAVRDLTEMELAGIRVENKIERLRNPIFRAIDRDLYDRWHNDNYIS